MGLGEIKMFLHSKETMVNHFTSDISEMKLVSRTNKE